MKLQLRLIVILLVLTFASCGGSNNGEPNACLVEDFLSQASICELSNDNLSIIGSLSDFVCEISEDCAAASCPIGGFVVNGNVGLDSPIDFEILNSTPNFESVTISALLPSDSEPFLGTCRPRVVETCTDEEVLNLGLGICVDIPEDCFFQDEFDPECPAPDIAAACQLEGIEFSPRGYGCSFGNGEEFVSGTMSAGSCIAEDCFNLSCTIGFNINGIFTQVPIDLEITNPNPEEILFEADAVIDGVSGFAGTCGGIVF